MSKHITVQEPAGADLPPLWPARGLLRRQRLALGRRIRSALDPARRLAAQARHRRDPQQALSSAEPWQERTLPPHAEGRGVRAAAASATLPRCKRALDGWRTIYNLERPHQALGQDVPASRYRPSSRAMPARCRSSNMTTARSSAPSAPPRPTSASRAGSGTSRRPFAANASPSGPREPRRPIWRLLRRPPDRKHRLDPTQKCQRCLRTGVGHVPGLNT